MVISSQLIAFETLLLQEIQRGFKVRAELKGY